MRTDLAVPLIVFSLCMGSVPQQPQQRAPRPPASLTIETARPQAIDVPNLIGKTRSDAETTLEGLGLHLRNVEQGELPPHTVARVTWQNPPYPGRVPAGTYFDILIGRGPAVPANEVVAPAKKQVAKAPKQALVPGAQAASRRTTVPALYGMTMDQASLALTKANLGGFNRVLERVIAGRPERTIVEQSPFEDTEVPYGARVDVRLAVAPPLVDVPELRGAILRDAAAALRAAGLQGGRLEKRPAVQPLDTVIDQTPRPPAKVPRGTTVDVVAVDPQLAVVPQLQGTSIAAARKMSGDAGFPLAEQSQPSDATEGTVVAQSPLANAQVAPGSTITVAVATRAASPPIQPDSMDPIVPNLIGLLLGDARRVAQSVRLDVAPTPETAETDAGRKAIASQDPTAGVRVKRGALVVVRLIAPSPGPDSATASSQPPPRTRNWPIPPWLVFGGGAVATALAGGLWRLIRGPANAVALHQRVDAALASLRLNASDASPTCDMTTRGEAIDFEVRLEIKRDPGWQTAEGPGAAILEETVQGER